MEYVLFQSIVISKMYFSNYYVPKSVTDTIFSCQEVTNWEDLEFIDDIVTKFEMNSNVVTVHYSIETEPIYSLVPDGGVIIQHFVHII